MRKPSCAESHVFTFYSEFERLVFPLDDVMPPKKRLKPDENQCVITSLFKCTTTSNNDSELGPETSPEGRGPGTCVIRKEPESKQQSKEKEQLKREREFKETWKTIFPWLVYTDGNHLFDHFIAS